MLLLRRHKSRNFPGETKFCIGIMFQKNVGDVGGFVK